MRWIGVDLDRTLAEYHGPENRYYIGEPIPLMAERVRKWIADGREVRIFTARVGDGREAIEIEDTVKMIQDWTQIHFGKRLAVTCRKDPDMDELWDDRCVQVIPNTGETIIDFLNRAFKREHV